MNLSLTFSSLVIGILAFSPMLSLADEFYDFEGFAETQETTDATDAAIVRFADGSTYDTRKEDADRLARAQDLLDPNAAPKIFAPSAVDVTPTSATIQWLTDHPANGIVYLTTFLPADPTNGDTTLFAHFDLLMGHSVDLTNLRDGATYYYRVESRDESGKNSTVAEHSFTTPVE